MGQKEMERETGKCKADGSGTDTSRLKSTDFLLKYSHTLAHSHASSSTPSKLPSTPMLESSLYIDLILQFSCSLLSMTPYILLNKAKIL